MKKLIVLSFITFSSIVSAQVTKNLGDFTKVTVFDKISVQLIASNENKIVIKGDRAATVQIVSDNEELKIKMPFDQLMKGADIEATVYFKKLEGIEANEGSYISCEDQIKATDFSLIAKEGGQIKVTVDALRIKVKSTNGSVIKLEGKAQYIDVVINSGGILEAEKCESSQATIAVNAGGSADVRASDLVDAKTRAGGNITIYGNPKQVNQKTVLGGNIILSKR
jgi:Putative auto-transporter adhesin, head GIN domain